MECRTLLTVLCFAYSSWTCCEGTQEVSIVVSVRRKKKSALCNQIPVGHVKLTRRLDSVLRRSGKKQEEQYLVVHNSFWGIKSLYVWIKDVTVNCCFLPSWVSSGFVRNVILLMVIR